MTIHLFGTEAARGDVNVEGVCARHTIDEGQSQHVQYSTSAAGIFRPFPVPLDPAHRFRSPSPAHHTLTRVTTPSPFVLPSRKSSLCPGRMSSGRSSSKMTRARSPVRRMPLGWSSEMIRAVWRICKRHGKVSLELANFLDVYPPS